MICDRILGNLGDGEPWLDHAARDVIDLTWFECFRRAVKKRTRGGRSVGLLLPLGTTLHHGDVVWKDDGGIIAVEVRPCEVLAVRPATLAETGMIAAELGNLHVPLEVRRDGTLLVLPDGPVEGVLRRYGASAQRETVRFSPLRASVPEELKLAEGFSVVRRDISAAPTSPPGAP
ncbi:MAG TPA: urease accessory protein UreE [Tepidisphaeraceae bacterium]|nr:urease accessory protein UreE [Tepidisphaeraceae bacterium]